MPAPKKARISASQILHQSSQVFLLLVLHGEALAAGAATTREDFAAVGGLAALEESVNTESAAPLQLIQHSRGRVQGSSSFDKGLLGVVRENSVCVGRAME